MTPSGWDDGMPQVDIASVSVGMLTTEGEATRVTHAFADANDYTFTDDVPAGTKTIEVYCDTKALVALGESSVTYGRRVGGWLGGLPMTFVLNDACLAAVAAGVKLHASGTQGQTIEVVYLPS
jgi:hypothetical protein